MNWTFHPAAIAAMRVAARAAHPREACGLLLGEGRGIRTATVARNVHPESLRHFEIDPAALIAAHRAARAGGPELIGYWHSHPNGLAMPSATDRAHASGDGRIWAIVAGESLTVWQEGPKGFDPLSYSVKDG